MKRIVVAACSALCVISTPAAAQHEHNYTVVTTGSAMSPTRFMLDNSFSGTLGTNQAAVRFVNLAPGTTNLFNTFIGTIGAGGTLHATNIAVGSPTTFNTVSSGSNTFTVLHPCL